MVKKKDRILVVGGTGFIGYHLAKKCLEKGWEVTSISLNPAKKIRYLPEVKYIFCDITKKKFLKKKIKKHFHYVVNLGGYVDHSNTKRVLKSHYEGCKNLTEIFLKKLPLSFVQIGSSLEYGNSITPNIESMKCSLKQIKSIYGKAKLLCSKHVMDLFKKKNFPSTVLRLYLAYGPKQDVNRFLPIIIMGCIKNKKFACSEGVQLRDLTHISDVVDAILKSLTNKNARGQIINIGSGKPRKIRNVIEDIKKISKGGYPQYGTFKLRKSEILKLYPSIKKAKSTINWRPKISFEKGLRSTIKYYNEQGI